MTRKLPLIAAAALATLACGSAFAQVACQAHPQAEWASEGAVRTHTEAQGVTFKSYKVVNNCFFVVGKERDGGRKVALYLDTKTLELVGNTRAK